MRIFVASDIHGRIKRMEILKKRIEEFHPDKIFFLGDFMYNGPRNGVPDDYDPIGTSDLLNEFADKVIAVRGNCDSRVDGFLLKFPLEDYRRFELDGINYDLYHGDDFSLELLKPQKGDFLISGHTHIQILEEKDGMFFLNPGSTSFPKGGNEPSYATIEGKHVAIRRLMDGSVIKEMDLK